MFQNETDMLFQRSFIFIRQEELYKAVQTCSLSQLFKECMSDTVTYYNYVGDTLIYIYICID